MARKLALGPVLHVPDVLIARVACLSQQHTAKAKRFVLCVRFRHEGAWSCEVVAMKVGAQCGHPLTLRLASPSIGVVSLFFFSCARATAATVKMRAWSTQLANERLERQKLADQEMADYWAYLERVREQADSREGGGRRWRGTIRSCHCCGSGLSGRPEVLAVGHTYAFWRAEAGIVGSTLRYCSSCGF